jgi:hypothetical protein
MPRLVSRLAHACRGRSRCRSVVPVDAVEVVVPVIGDVVAVGVGVLGVEVICDLIM